MTQDYQKTWEAMNSLESVTSKICSAREILDSAIESLESGNRQKTETLLYAVDEFLQYYLEDFDRKFKVAWNETVVKLKEEDPCMPPWGHSDLEYLSKHKESLTCDNDDSSPECKGSWTSFWEENYYPEEYKGSTVSSVKQDKVKRWVLPVEEVENGDTGEQEYFITFPDDLLEAANLTEGDQVEWVDNKDGTYTLKKTGNELARVKTYKEIGNELARVKTYQEMINDGWSMTDDGFWIKE
jgi:bifunctional DNA-binding transcriptional regulator/antitoxin component of YhaV-PrlF toxin-antitoxin module